MNEIVAFCSQLPLAEEKFWINEISQLASDFIIVPFEQLSKQQKLQVTVAIVANPNPKALLELVNLQWVQSLWSGVERLLTELDSEKIKIVRMIDPNLSNIMAEAVLAWTLYLHRDMPTYRNQQQKNIWIQHPVIEISDCQVSILGLGELGSTSANKLIKNGFQVNGWSRSPANIADVNCYHGKAGLANMLKNTDILISLLPLTPETTGLLNKNTLTLLPHSASLINFSRGDIIVESDLLSCLENNQLKHAVLDVFHQEPLGKEHPFWSAEKVTVLPHISAPTSKKTAAKIVAKNLQCFFKNNIIPEYIDHKKGY